MSEVKDSTPVEYREIPRLVGYRFGDDGSFWSRWNRNGAGLTDHWRRLEGTPDKDGYVSVSPKNSLTGKTMGHRLHRLVLEAFVGPCPPGMEACHVPDGDRSNNRLENLSWSTHVVNVSDKVAHGTTQVGTKHGMAKLTEAQVIEIRGRLTAGASGPELAREYGVHKCTITRAAYGDTWAEATQSNPASRPAVMRNFTKINESDVREIRRLREGGMIYREIASQYGVVKETVQKDLYGASVDRPEFAPDTPGTLKHPPHRGRAGRRRPGPPGAGPPCASPPTPRTTTGPPGGRRGSTARWAASGACPRRRCGAPPYPPSPAASARSSAST